MALDEFAQKNKFCTFGLVKKYLAEIAEDNLFGKSIMTCATCHEVHNKENAIQDTYANNNGNTHTTRTAPNYFLYAKETSSLICLSCHIK